MVRQGAGVIEIPVADASLGEEEALAVAGDEDKRQPSKARS